jgi:presqualene diphosphate synthase
MSEAAFPAVEADQKAAIRAKVAAAGTSFYWAMRLLPAARRDAMFAVYAFCREVDDIADSADAPATKRAGLAAWRREIDAIYHGKAQWPLGRVLAEAVAAYRLRREDFLAVIDGMEMDAAADIRAPKLAELDRYCDCVAGAVGRLSVRIFGTDSPAADTVAGALGRALQLTNILRDLVEDAERGRLYLPREILLAHGIAGADPQAVLRHRRLPAVCE